MEKKNDKVQTIAAVIATVAAALGIIFTVLQLSPIWDRSINVAIPLMGVVNACNACIHWNTNRKLAYFSIGAAVFILICSIVVFCL